MADEARRYEATLVKHLRKSGPIGICALGTDCPRPAGVTKLTDFLTARSALFHLGGNGPNWLVTLTAQAASSPAAGVPSPAASASAVPSPRFLSYTAPGTTAAPPSPSLLRSAVMDETSTHTTYAEAAQRGGTELEDFEEGESGDSDRLDLSALRDYFSSQTSIGDGALDPKVVVADAAGAVAFPSASLLGVWEDGKVADSRVFLNTHQPFCLVAVGVQGGGKSHTMACVLEACLLPCPHADVVHLQAPMAALVLHYDTSPTAVIESTGLLWPAPAVRRLLGPAAVRLPRSRCVVLVSPAYLKQRRAFYGGAVDVRPLLLRWSSLTADHIKRLMRLKESDNQLYVASLLDLLRRYQRRGEVPVFSDFVGEVKELCNIKGQEAALTQRLALLDSLVAESATNAPLRDDGGDLAAFVRPGTLVVVDMTDPLLARDEASGIFQVLLEQFRALPLRGAGKVIALDEAHKYVSADAGDGLSSALVTAARLMRHDGLRLLVSTQSPRTLAPELLELVSACAMHRFHSHDWFAHLAKKLPLGPTAWRAVLSLQPGHCLLFATRHALPHGAALPSEDDEEAGAARVGSVFRVAVRPRLTADRGASRTNELVAVRPSASAPVLSFVGTNGGRGFETS